MNILMLLNNHFTHDARVLKEAKSLAKNGHNVEVRCYWDIDLEKKEVIEGVQVNRILFTSRSHRKNVLHKYWLLVMFFLKCFNQTKSFDTIHCHDLLTLPIGVCVKLLNRRNQKIIYDSHEYQIEQNGKPKWIRPVLKLIEGFFIMHVHHVIVVSDSIANEYKRIYNIEKPSIILNCPPYSEVTQKDYFRKKFQLSNDKIIFLYQGGFSRNRGIEDILEVFSNVKDSKKIIIFMGYGAFESQIKDAASLNKHIFFHEAVGQDILPEYTASADVGILTYKNTCLNHYYCSPNKLFEYTMAGLPVIVSNLFELSRLTNQYDNGFILKENTANALQSMIDSITIDKIKSKQHNVIKIREEFCWENQEKILLNIYQQLS